MRKLGKTMAMLVALVAVIAAAMAPAAAAETGELSAFGSEFGTGPEQMFANGPVAIDPSDGNSIYLADAPSIEGGLFGSRLRKFSSNGTLEGVAEPSTANPSGANMFLAGLAVDSDLNRVYALMDAHDHGFGTSREVLVYSTVPDCSSNPCALVPPSGSEAVADGVADGVLVDFREVAFAAGSVDFATGIAVDPGTHKVAILGLDDATGVSSGGQLESSATNPNGVLQYISKSGQPSTRITGFTGGPDPESVDTVVPPGPEPEEERTTSTSAPLGLAIAPNGEVYLSSWWATKAEHFTYVENEDHSITKQHAPGWQEELRMYRLPREGAAASLFAIDPGAFVGVGSPPGGRANTDPNHNPGFLGNPPFGLGSQIAVSSDGGTVYVAEGATNLGTQRIRGYSTQTGKPRIVYGTGTVPTCATPIGLGGSIAAGAGDTVVGSSLFLPPFSIPSVHVYGEGGSGCQRPQPAFTLNGESGGTVTVTKGQEATLDISASTGLAGFGSAITSLDWDLDGSGAFATSTELDPGPDAIFGTADDAYAFKQRFVKLGSYQVGLKIESEFGVPEITDPVFQTVKVVPPVPTAAFKASTKSPAAGQSVSFDAGESLDPAGSPAAEPSHDLATYKWDFGDGTGQETSSKTISHPFANPDPNPVTRTVKLVVVSKDGVASPAAAQTITVAGTPPSNNGGGSGGGGSGGSSSSTPPPPPVAKPKPKATKCKKGQVKKKGKCVKKKAKKKKRGK